eukprot:642541-Karenia_brevis.AAC.1
MFWWLKKTTTTKLGGPGRICWIDETYFSKQKRSRGRFRGRMSAGNKTCMLGIVELNMTTRKET